MQQSLKGSQHNHEGGGAAQLANSGEIGERRSGESGSKRGANKGLLRRASMVERKELRISGHALELLLPEGKAALRRGPLKKFALPTGEISVLGLHGRKRVRCSAGRREIGLRQLFQQHTKGPSVGSNVMHGQHEHMFGL